MPAPLLTHRQDSRNVRRRDHRRALRRFALALMLARDGLKVLAIDRTTFPSDTMSGHFIHPAGVSCLRRLGLAESLAALGAPAQETMTVDFGPVVLAGAPAPAADGTSGGYAPRRYPFRRHAGRCRRRGGRGSARGRQLHGAACRGRPRVRHPHRSRPPARPRTSGRGSSSAPTASARASRRMVRRGSLWPPAAATCSYYAYWSGFDAPGTRLFVRDGLFCVAAPTNDGLTFVGMAWPHAEFARVRADIGSAYREAAATLPWVADRLASAEQVGRFVGTADLDGFFRTASGPGWALLGDAGYHKDPITAQGMTDAPLHAEMLAEAIVAELPGTVPRDRALADDGRRRDAAARPMYGLTADLARLAPPTTEMSALPRPCAATRSRPAASSASSPARSRSMTSSRPPTSPDHRRRAAAAVRRRRVAVERREARRRALVGGEEDNRTSSTERTIAMNDLLQRDDAPAYRMQRWTARGPLDAARRAAAARLLRPHPDRLSGGPHRGTMDMDLRGEAERTVAPAGSSERKEADRGGDPGLHRARAHVARAVRLQDPARQIDRRQTAHRALFRQDPVDRQSHTAVPARDDPRSRGLRVRMSPATGLSPSIAVLPFANMSSDLDQEHVADGLVEDIITALSHVPRLLVIARTSTLAHKGQPVDVRQVGRELGVPLRSRWQRAPGGRTPACHEPARSTRQPACTCGPTAMTAPSRTCSSCRIRSPRGWSPPLRRDCPATPLARIAPVACPRTLAGSTALASPPEADPCAARQRTRAAAVGLTADCPAGKCRC